MKNQIIRFRLLVIMLGVILFSFTSKAQTETLKVGTKTRTMLVYGPPAIEKNRPLLISMHGLNQDINYQQGQTQWETVAKANNFVVVYPAGINNSWDISGTTDTDFILAIINEMVKRYDIDRKRVYLSGFSMGGMMTYHAATKIADKIAAFAPVSGYLMGGPNTNSSRPIPIIHTHGTGDPVVPYSGVKTCLDAWITRNECPSTAKVTKPYPVGKTSSNGTKSVWGPGKDQVQVVLLSLEGVGHWHSNDGNGVNTSQEIWNFCKNYSLGFGVPEFISASVTDDNPKQIRMAFSNPLKKLDTYTGFAVKVDNVVVSIDSVVYSDTTHLTVHLADSILKQNDVLLTYYNGNVISTYDKKLENFKNSSVVNMLQGSAPIITEITTSKNGDSVLVRFNKKMLLPSDISSLVLTSEYNGVKNIPMLQGLFSRNDSTLLAFPLNERVYADYALSCSYSGNTIASSDSGLLRSVTAFPVTNISKGLPVQINSGRIDADGFTVYLAFSKPMNMQEIQLKQFVVKVNDVVVKAKEVFVSNTSIRFKLVTNVHFGDKVSLSYTPGTVTAADKGALDAFSDLALSNRVSAPAWVGLPAKIEAEKYIAQYGVQTEETSDTGGGSNVGYIDNGDWMEYAIDNSSNATSYQITFRVASTNNTGVISCYIDGKSVGSVSVPSTGNWQTFQSVTKNMTIPTGKHYLKLVTSTGGFNLNFLDIRTDLTDISKVSDEKVILSPNPVSDEINIHAIDFRHNKVEVYNIVGNKVISCATSGESDLRIPVQLSDGIYLVRISDDKQSQLTKIIVKNN